ncbi:MAG: acetyl-CoA acetyltransferase [Dehalococcoidia bacterium]|nr:MAG: acetyl-CoA acetyltransferase [Dehalococcoidia bacterium]
MEGIKDRVAIIGMGCTKFGELWDKSAEDMLVDSCFEAIEDAGIEPKDIKAGWFGTVMSGFSGQMLTHALKLEYIPVSRLENFCATATDAFMNACYAVAAGIYDIVIASGVEKLKDTGFAGLGTAGGGIPSSMVEPPVPPPVQFALVATRYAHHYGLSMEELKTALAKIAVKNHHNGTLNPRAHFRREITVEQVLNAPMIAWPLGLFDCCGVSDGAAAAIVTTPEIARKLKDDYVLVKGVRLVCGGKQGTLHDWYDFVHFDENVTASKMAYEEAGIKDPRKELDLAIVHDCFSITEMLIYEDLQFSPRGKAKEDIDAGTFTLEGELPVNTDGGLKCFGHPIGASGLRMLYEVYKQLQGKAEQRQLKKADIGLTHNLGGMPGSFTCAVAILGRRD